jgi:hypothetical protein
MEPERYARVATRMRAFVRPAAGPDTLPMPLDNPALETAPLGETLEGANLSAALTDFLLALSAKLDTVVSLLSQKRLEDDFEAAVEVLEIGAQGLDFVAPRPWAAGAVLEFALVLNQYPLRLAAAVGRVEAVAESPAGPRHSVTFTRIREADFEAVVHFVINEERQQIRESRWSR